MSTLLLDAALETPGPLTLARVAGVALLALAVASGFAQRDAGSRAIHGMVGAMLVYNEGAASILAHGGVALGLSGIGLWPTVALHAALAVRCIACLSKASASRPGPQPEPL